jgi:hypothetical protein
LSYGINHKKTGFLDSLLDIIAWIEYIEGEKDEESIIEMHQEGISEREIREKAWPHA